MIQRKKSWLAFLLALVLTCSLAGPSQAAEPQVERIHGQSRYETALKVSQAAFSAADYAVIASGESFPDALVGGVLAGHLEGPLLTTSKDQLASGLVEELERLGVKKVYLLGGENTLSKELEESLAQFSPARLAGENRYATAEKVGQELKALKPNIEQVFYADGRNFPDALAAAPYVVGQGGYLLLSDGQAQNQGIALGGQNSVPGSLERIAGSNRYDTAVKIAEKSKDVQGVILVDGQGYADALAAAGLAAQKNYAILLTPSQALSQEVAAYLKDKKVENILVIGGRNSVSKQLVDQLLGKESPKEEENPKIEKVNEHLQMILDIQAKRKNGRDLVKRYAKEVGMDSYLNHYYEVKVLEVGDFDGNGHLELLMMTHLSKQGRVDDYYYREDDAIWYLSEKGVKAIDGNPFLTYFGSAKFQGRQVFSFTQGKGNPIILTGQDNQLVELSDIHKDRWSIRRLELSPDKSIALLRGDASDNFKHSAEAEIIFDFDAMTYDFGKILKVESY